MQDKKYFKEIELDYKKHKKISSFILYFCKPYKWYLLAMFFLQIIYSSHGFAKAYLFELFVEGLSSISGEITDFKTAFYIVAIPFIGIILIKLIQEGSLMTRVFLDIKILPKIRTNIRNSLYKHTMKQDYGFFVNNNSGIISDKIQRVSEFLPSFLRDLNYLVIGPVLALFIGVLSIYRISPLLSIVMLFFIVTFFMANFLFSKIIVEKSKIAAKEKSVLNGFLVDSLSNFLSVILFNTRKKEYNFLNIKSRKEIKTDQNMERLSAKLHILKMIYAWMYLCINLTLIIYLYSKSSITLGHVVFIITATDTTLKSCWTITNYIKQIFHGAGIMKNSIDFLMKKPVLEEDKKVKDIKLKKAHIKFENVDFAYNDNKKNKIFKGLYLDIKENEKVGVVGLSGAGKSSLVNLLLNFYKTDKGNIIINSKNIKKISQGSLRENISVIPQNTNLFFRTILENIKYGKQEASLEEVKKVAKLANIDTFIESLPEKYSTLVGNQGVKLSGGQRQRIAIARAFLKDSPILILDEATSSLDSESEQYIQKSLESLMKNKTTIVIAHRLSTLKKMDKIVVLDKGKIVEEGSHKVLLKKKGLYAKMWKLQSEDK